MPFPKPAPQIDPLETLGYANGDRHPGTSSVSLVSSPVQNSGCRPPVHVRSIKFVELGSNSKAERSGSGGTRVIIALHVRGEEAETQHAATARRLFFFLSRIVET